MTDLMQLGQQAKDSAQQLALMPTNRKNELLVQMAQTIKKNQQAIIEANHKDLEKAVENNISETMQDRLQLTPERINAMATEIEKIASLDDPIGKVDEMWTNTDGLRIGKKRVPLGVIGIIYESRPNVTTDAASLAFKSGNAVILRGGKEAFFSNQLLVQLLQQVLVSAGESPYAIQFVDDTSHETAGQLMRLTEYLDVLIPRGGAKLIQRVKEQATVPIIETGTGNNHVYIDKEAQLSMAVNIIVNAKASRPSVCNAAETLLIHSEIAPFFLPAIEKELVEHGVSLRADARALEYLETAALAEDTDWDTEYLDYILAVKVVDSLGEAIAHINRHNTKHSETIVTDSYAASQRFLNEVDAAAVYVNASTRFTDGSVFGFGAEIGISTQKLHARGPMGLNELTSTKYIIYGDGQIRE
ncbi:TPA: glutamate-5-semialdehyde dehydrogenase [Enterococcus faecium]|jgi:glutamate-5-semialdehyde dehydrogenase|uniref:Gamma-glutamyl phosphate reductase n=1 Tax=Enterococcus faecium TaxID=1352 RepID=A0A2D0BT00_ENTFC|nr:MULTISPECIES: glutamate-5-semialdehyde dehydrogenase [Enterococcus]ELA61649.1 gamma-glutamyl phosphate reductase [Enterococcus faecium EnGen0014]ELB23746.1 gamma-glutamyl phosphate reductase [Enterococcus faecium EnGen0039]ELB59156.1 gamma-glutamyl phosphate reductase [Enterococcus faecium EnGen0052]EME8115611.1 glutamate-5-semialdehyde dehydrogenase [Enterococcus faecium]EMF0399516.1 glutamate-5-semialdehyde dehydrogenase [Enterococcus faecium]